MDELVDLALEDEFVVQTEIECHRDPVARRDGPALASAPLDEDLVRLELMLSDAEAAVRQLLELARRERLTHCAELRAQLRAELREVRLHLQLDRFDRPKLDTFHAQLVRHFLDVAVESRALDDEPAQ